jgi:mannose-6-phosphate isomerase-like protein (cupin superfamily)
MTNPSVERWREIHAPSPTMLRFLMERDGYQVSLWNDRAGMFYGIHKRDEEQSYWIISGKLEITFENGTSYTLKNGDRDFIPAGSWHSARVLGEEPVMYLVGEKINRKRGRRK